MTRLSKDRKKRASVKKAAMLDETLAKIEQELSILQRFRRSPQIEKLERHLQGERSYIIRQKQILTNTGEDREKERQRRLAAANKSRSHKMQRTWRYRKAMRKNWAPDKSEREIGSLYKKHREGLETDIPDVAWRNPSP